MEYIIVYNGDCDFEIVDSIERVRVRIAELIEEGNSPDEIALYEAKQKDYSIVPDSIKIDVTE